MPSNFTTVAVNDSDSDEEGGCRLRRDEYGEPFEDYGFLKRAEEYKAAGNEAFKKERYQSALEKYNEALDQLITVAHDKSIVLGQKKWNDVVVLRSMIHLNMSTCHFKLKEWEKSVSQALECLVGNMREESMMTDPHVRMKLKATERKQGTSGLHELTLEQRLPRPTRAKAWFRLSQCYANLDYVDRAKESLAKALEVCDDDKVLAEISQHSVRLEVLDKEQKDRQKKQFAGFFDKLQERGGYADDAGRENVATAASSSSQRARFEELDNDDD
mmetsp:Transcript_2226/g.3845  ORF Transcript_2226/g.3845 Transcript_2226/m.3845 type:complete len:273 (-) Transcript_2226:24-842(-)